MAHGKLGRNRIRAENHARSDGQKESCGLPRLGNLQNEERRQMERNHMHAGEIRRVLGHRRKPNRRIRSNTICSTDGSREEGFLKTKFKEMLDSEKTPYRHQLDAAELLLQGKSVVLRAPCGSGKSEAVLVPFLLEIEKEGTMLPHHLIYSLPMRVLTENLAKRV